MSHYVFGYGSLMWRPDFEFVSRHKASLQGYHRSLCISSHVHRGTVEKPGLVMGLDVGGECCGVVYEVEATKWGETHAYLTAREMINYVYEEKYLNVTLPNAQSVRALVYVVDRTHLQYTRQLTLAQQAKRIKDAVGKSGKNTNYVIETVKALRELQIHDEALEDLLPLLVEQA